MKYFTFSRKPDLIICWLFANATGEVPILEADGVSMSIQDVMCLCANMGLNCDILIFHLFEVLLLPKSSQY